MALRSYKVLSAEDAKARYNLAAKGEHNRYVLISERGSRLDSVVAWGYRDDSLQKIADKRNGDLDMLGKMMGKAEADLTLTE